MKKAKKKKTIKSNQILRKGVAAYYCCLMLYEGIKIALVSIEEYSHASLLLYYERKMVSNLMVIY